MITNFLDADVSNIVGGIRRVSGDLLGLELEHEGRNLRKADGTVDRPVMAAWSVHNDGSLRNNHGDAIEWVFKKPYDLEKSLTAVDILFKFLDENKAKIVCSNRTSTHVHFNMSDKAVYQVLNTFFLFTIFEDILDTYCGEDRRGNLFCLSSRMAEGNFRLLYKSVTKFQHFAEFGEGVRYSSFNLSSLNKFGTVEFRAMRGLSNADDVKAWVSIIHKLCTFACYELYNPVDLLVDVSRETPVGMLRKVFGEHAQLLIDKVGEQFVDQSVYEGVRLIQPLVYEVGNSFKGVKFRGPDFWAGLKKAKKEEEPAFDMDDVDEEGFLPPPRPRGARLFQARVEPAPDQGLEAPHQRMVADVEQARARLAQQAREAAEQPRRGAQINRLNPVRLDDRFVNGRRVVYDPIRGQFVFEEEQQEGENGNG